METIDFNEVIRDNIEVVGELIPYLVYSLDTNKITDANNSVDGVYKLPSTVLNMPSGETGLGCFCGQYLGIITRNIKCYGGIRH